MLRVMDDLKTILTRRQIEVLAMIYFDGLTQQEAADQLGISLRAIKGIVSRGHKRLAARGLTLHKVPLERAVVQTMDPAIIDSLGPREIQGVV